MKTIRSNPFLAASWAGFMQLLVAVAIFGSAGRALAQANANPPERMTYQGFLTDANGTPLGNSAPKNYDVIFRIWKSESSTAAGDRLWTEQQTVTVDKGYFSVLLGEGGNIGESKPALSAVFTGADASDRWVGVTVKGIGVGGADATILPRLRMLTSPYSYLAQKAITATTVDGGALTSGTVADARLSANVALRAGGNTFTGNQVVSSGNVGIGTASPAGRLHVNGGSLVLSGGDISMDNSRVFTAKNAAGTYETWCWPRWSDNVTYLNFGTGGFNIRNNASASRMFLTDSGNVGIGTTGPQDRLEVNGGRLIVNGTSINTTPFTGLGLQYNYADGEGAIMSSFNDGYGYLSFYTKELNGKPITRRMTITTTGRVGIGTPNPVAAFHVTGSRVLASGSANYINYIMGNNAGVPDASAAGAVIAFFDGQVLANDSIVSMQAPNFSDARAKKIVGRSSGDEDLNAIDRLRITDFRWIDQTKGITGVQKKVIAQEVEEVLPQAVSRVTNLIPSVFQSASKVVYDPEKRQVTLTLTKAHDFKPGEEVDVYTDSGDLTKTKVVATPSADSFAIASENPVKSAFVYGKWVSDYRVVDYDAIAMLNVSATQELHRKLKSQADEINQLKQALAAMVAKAEQRERDLDAAREQAALQTKNLHGMLAEIEGRDQRLAAIEQLLREKFPQQHAALKTGSVVGAK